MYAIPLHQNLEYPERLIHGFDENSFLLDRLKRVLRRTRLQSLDQRFQFSQQVNQFSCLLENSSDAVFQSIKQQTIHEVQKTEFNEDVFIRTMSLVRHAIFQQTGLKVYETQIIAASAMLDNCLAEMQTGEGKSLAITLAAGTAALFGLPVHVITANDYLAERDAQLAKHIFSSLNLSVGIISAELEFEQRHSEYQNNIVFTTARELIFDYLRDTVTKPKKPTTLHGMSQTMTNGSVQNTQALRGLCFAIIDEADSILLDEATTPFVISQQGKQKFPPEHYQLALDLAHNLIENDHFQIIKSHGKVSLTEPGIQEVELRNKDQFGLWQVHRFRSYLVEQALAAIHLFHRDQNYLIQDGEIVIVDAVTGRVAEGRKWSQGIHQLIELKEGLEITEDTEQKIKMTYQEFFPRYLKLGGTSGTLAEDQNELNQSYGLPVVKIPLRLPSQRISLPQKLFLTQTLKWQQVIDCIIKNQTDLKPVLVTVGSVEDAESLSDRLHQIYIKHVTLNARQDAAEAEIIADAGKPGSVTIATNIAGRGTDIKLNSDSLEYGGLQIIRCHLNHSRRIDRQVSGRCARNGQPGVVETLLAMDDHLITLYTPGLLMAALRKMHRSDRPLPTYFSNLLIYTCQLRAKWHARRQRWRLKQQTITTRKMMAIRDAAI